jgi:hypothetical protein
MARIATIALSTVLLGALPASATASVRVEKTITVQPAPHGGIQPDGTLEQGQSVQTTHVKLPASAGPCTWFLTDPRTGRMPGDPFVGQEWRLLFAGLSAKRRWSLSFRLLNNNTSDTGETARHWRLVLRCSTPRRHPACALQAIHPPKPADYVEAGLFCIRPASRFSVTVPRGVAITRIYGADNVGVHETMSCGKRGRVISCRGRMPAYTTTQLGFFLTKPVPRSLALSLSVPRVGKASTRTRALDVRF